MDEKGLYIAHQCLVCYVNSMVCDAWCAILNPEAQISKPGAKLMQAVQGRTLNIEAKDAILGFAFPQEMKFLTMLSPGWDLQSNVFWLYPTHLVALLRNVTPFG